MVRSARFCVRFEHVEEVQGIAAFVERSVDGHAYKTTEERDILREAEARIGVCEASSCGRKSKGKNCCGDVCKSTKLAPKARSLPDMLGSRVTQPYLVRA